MVRRVRTPEGARFYNKPIGTPITRELIASAKSRWGTKSPSKLRTGNRKAAKKSSKLKAPRYDSELHEAFKSGRLRPNTDQSDVYEGVKAGRISVEPYQRDLDAKNGNKARKPQSFGDQELYSMIESGRLGESAPESDAIAEFAAQFETGGEPDIEEIRRLFPLSGQVPKFPAGSTAVKVSEESNTVFVRQPDGTVRVMRAGREVKLSPQIQAILPAKLDENTFWVDADIPSELLDTPKTKVNLSNADADILAMAGELLELATSDYRTVRTQEGEERYGVSIGQRIPRNNGKKDAGKKTVTVERLISLREQYEGALSAGNELLANKMMENLKLAVFDYTGSNKVSDFIQTMQSLDSKKK